MSRITKKKILAVITVISAAIGVIAASEDLFLKWRQSEDDSLQAQEETEKVKQEAEQIRMEKEQMQRQLDGQNQQSILQRLTYAQDLLKNCNISPQNKATIEDDLNSAINEIKLNGTTSKSNLFFNFDVDALIHCTPSYSIIPSENTTEYILPSPAYQPMTIVPIVFLAIATIFGVIWYKEYRK